MMPPKKTDDLRILIIQLRKDPAMLPAERKGFVELSRLSDRQFQTLDVYRRPSFPAAILDDYDAFFIGGLSDDPSGSAEISKALFPFIDSLNEMVRYAIRIKKPGLMSCGGFMLLSKELGAEIIIDPERAELGVVPIELTKAGREDPLFEGFPGSFKAVSGHQKSTKDTPPGCILLAGNERCPVHGLRIKGTPIYAFQFHPEIRCQELRARVEGYRSKYFDDETAYLEFIQLMDDTSDANRIIRRFIELVLQHTAPGGRRNEI